MKLKEKSFRELDGFFKHSVAVKKDMIKKINDSVEHIFCAVESNGEPSTECVTALQYFDSLCQQLTALCDAEEGLTASLAHEHEEERAKAMKGHVKIVKDKHKRFAGNF